MRRGEDDEARAAPDERPLAGLTVLEANSADSPLALRLATALAGRMFADMGARLIKLEPTGGDPLRTIPPMAEASSALSTFLDAGKKSVVAPPGEFPRMVRRLGARLDIALTDQSLFDGLAADAWPQVTAVVSMGPADQPELAQGSEFTLMARSGLLDIIGDPARAPLRLGGHQLAYSAGLALYTGAVAAHTAVDAGREVVRTNLLDMGVWLNWKGAAAASWGAAAPARLGDDAEWRVIRCADGWVALVHREDNWQALKALVGDVRLEDPRFATRSMRRPHGAEIAGIVEQALMRLTRDQIRDAALAHRIPLGPVWSIQELASDPQYLVRDFLQLAHPQSRSEIRIPRLPVLWGRRAFAPGPATGPGGSVDDLDLAS